VKCCEVTKCTDKERQSCYVWNSFRQNSDDFENIKCWILKNVYLPENRELLRKCLKCNYYMMMNKQTGLVSDFDPEIALIKCEGVVNYERTKAISDIWEQLRKSNRSKVVLDLTNVNNIYSCGLGVIVKIHKDTQEMGGQLVVVGAQGYVMATFETTKLSRLMRIVGDAAEAREVFDAIKRSSQAAEAVTKEAEVASAKPVPRKRVPCWEYFKNHNPRNATVCDECFRKINPSSDPCWIVEGVIEGVSFQYVNEDCGSCEYFTEFGNSQPG